MCLFSFLLELFIGVRATVPSGIVVMHWDMYDHTAGAWQLIALEVPFIICRALGPLAADQHVWTRL